MSANTDRVLALVSNKRTQANAWRRAMLNDDGTLHADGKIILKTLTKPAHYFGVGYIPGDHDRTLIMAVRRETVNRILKLINFDESKILEAMQDDDD